MVVLVAYDYLDLIHIGNQGFWKLHNLEWAITFRVLKPGSLANWHFWTEGEAQTQFLSNCMFSDFLRVVLVVWNYFDLNQIGNQGLWKLHN